MLLSCPKRSVLLTYLSGKDQVKDCSIHCSHNSTGHVRLLSRSLTQHIPRACHQSWHQCENINTPNPTSACWNSFQHQLESLPTKTFKEASQNVSENNSERTIYLFGALHQRQSKRAFLGKHPKMFDLATCWLQAQMTLVLEHTCLEGIWFTANTQSHQKKQENEDDVNSNQFYTANMTWASTCYS